MLLIDSHAHLQMPEFDSDLEDVLERAKKVGIERIVLPGSTLAESEKGWQLAQKYPELYCAIGLSPHDAKDLNDSCKKSLEKLARQEKVVAIGETGLDFYRNLSPPDKQRESFQYHINLASELDLPLIVHDRGCNFETLNWLKKAKKNLKVILHCYSMGLEPLPEIIEAGYYLSLAGPVTYKNAEKLRQVSKLIPDDLLLIETDAPYLTPQPYRGKRNEPIFLLETLKVIAFERAIEPEKLAQKISENSFSIFNWKNISK